MRRGAAAARSQATAAAPMLLQRHTRAHGSLPPRAPRQAARFLVLRDSDDGERVNDKLEDLDRGTRTGLSCPRDVEMQMRWRGPTAEPGRRRRAGLQSGGGSGGRGNLKAVPGDGHSHDSSHSESQQSRSTRGRGRQGAQLGEGAGPGDETLRRKVTVDATALAIHGGDPRPRRRDPVAGSRGAAASPKMRRPQRATLPDEKKGRFELL